MARASLVDAVVADAEVAGAKVAGAARVSLQTEVGNEPATALYRGVGFEVVDGLTMLDLTL